MGARLKEQGRDREVGPAVVVGALDVHAWRHVSIRSSRWRAQEWTWWGADLGRSRAESDIGSKMKFEDHELLFIFHLGTMVIRALH